MTGMSGGGESMRLLLLLMLSSSSVRELRRRATAGELSIEEFRLLLRLLLALVPAEFDDV